MPPAVTSALAKPSEPEGLKHQRAEPGLGTFKGAVGEVGEFAGEAEALGQGFGEAGGEGFGKNIAQGGARAGALGGDEPAGFMAGEEVDGDFLAVPPVARDLQDGGAGKTLVGEQCRLTEPRLAATGDHLGGDARQGAEQGLVRPESQRYQGGARFHHLQAEAAGDIIGKAAGAQLGDGQAAGGDDQGRGAGGAITARYPELPVGVAEVGDRARQGDLDPAD